MYKLLVFELRLQSRQWAFLLLIVFYFGLNMFLAINSYGGENELINSAYKIAFHQAFVSLTYVFPIMFFAVKAALRDEQYQFGEIIFATAISRGYFFTSRWLGVVSAVVLIALASLLGFAVGIALADVGPARRMAFSLGPYFRVFGFILLPNCLILSTLIFGLSLWIKNSTATYFSAFSIYAAYWLCALFLNSPLLANAVAADPKNLALAAYFDPFGLSAFFAQTQYWTILEQNKNPLELGIFLLSNRALWLSLSLLFFGLTYLFFAWRKTPTAGRQRPDLIPTQVEKPQTINWLNVPPTSFFTHLLTFGVMVRQQIRFLFTSLPFLLSVLALVGIMGVEMYSHIQGGGSYRENLLPTTAILIERLVDPLNLFAILLLLFYAGELMGRAKAHQFDQILATSPLSRTVHFLALFFSLLSIPFSLVSLAIGCGLAMQYTLDYSPMQGVFWLGMYYYQLLPLALYTLFILGVQLLSSNKYIGLLLSALLLLLLASPLAVRIGLHHPLLRLAYLPSVLPADMNAYGFSPFAFHHYAVYWSAFLLLFSLLAIRFWQYPKQAIQPLYLFLLLPVLLIAGSKIYYHTVLKANYQSPSQAFDLQEDYERKFKRYEPLLHLSYQSISTEIDFFPKKRTANIKAQHQLTNRQTVPIEQVFLSARIALDSVYLEGATCVAKDSIHHTALFRFHRPIVPGDSLLFSYQLTLKQTAFSTDMGLAKNGSFLLAQSFEPVAFYRKSREIGEAHERSKRGLAPRPEIDHSETQLHHQTVGLGRVNFETILSTTAQQTAIAPGQLLRQWTEGDRSYFHYRTAQKVIPMISYLSGNYQVQQATHRGIQLEQYYHPAHHQNIDSIEHYAKATLNYCSSYFGPYLYDHLRIAEIPSHWPFGGQALAGTISMVADKLYLVDIRDPQAFNLIAKRTIHEVAHQWWGHLLAPKNVAGAELIIEGLAKYTEAMVMRQLFGPAAMEQLRIEANEKYLRGRAFEQETEPPLYLVDGQSYLAYGKACLAFIATSELIGEAKLNQALRQLVQEFGQQDQPQLLSLDLLDAIQAVTPEKDHYLLDKWFKQNTQW